MSDDLVEWLRDWPYQGETMAEQAADRIEELEAKLAKAVEALAGVEMFVRDLSPFAYPSHRPVPALAIACEVYAELTSSVAADNEVKGDEDE